MNLNGLLVGLVTFLIIGIFHPLVIKAEYHFGVRSWWAFAFCGVLFCLLSLLTDGIVLSVILGVIAFSCFWSILEVFHQHKRVEDGRFPAGPGHKSCH